MLCFLPKEKTSSKFVNAEDTKISIDFLVNFLCQRELMDLALL